MEIKQPISNNLPIAQEGKSAKNILSFDFRHLNLVPRYFDGTSRRNIDTSVKVGQRNFNLPIVPANMESIITEDIAIQLAVNNNFYVMHRFDVDNIEFVKKMHLRNLFASISVGVRSEDIVEVEKMVQLGLFPEFLTIDIAHGHSKMMKEAIAVYRKLLPETFIIAGNIATSEAAIDIVNWGADAIKIGVAPGRTCITAMKTGFGTRDLQAGILLNIKNELLARDLDTFIIIDGGLKEEGDIAKSLVLGADMCMIGNLLAGYKDSPGEIIEMKQEKFKSFYGSASGEMKNKNSYIEGKKIYVSYKDMTILERYQEIKEALQSAISYGGGHTVADLKNVEFMVRNY